MSEGKEVSGFRFQVPTDGERDQFTPLSFEERVEFENWRAARKSKKQQESYPDHNGDGVPDAFENRPSITEVLNSEAEQSRFYAGIYGGWRLPNIGLPQDAATTTIGTRSEFIERCTATRQLDIAPVGVSSQPQSTIEAETRASRRYGRGGGAKGTGPIYVKQQCLLTKNHGGTDVDHVYPGAVGLPQAVPSKVYHDRQEFYFDQLDRFNWATHDEVNTAWNEYYAQHRVFYFGLPKEAVSSPECQVSSPHPETLNLKPETQSAQRQTEVYRTHRTILVDARVGLVAELDRTVASELLIGIENGKIVSCPFAASDDLPEYMDWWIGPPLGDALRCVEMFPRMTIGDMLYRAAEFIMEQARRGKDPLLDYFPHLNFTAIEIDQQQIRFVLSK